MTSLNLVPRAGEMSIMFETESSGDEARMTSIPFGTLAANGGSISMPKSVELTLRGVSGIPIGEADVVCQAFKDARGTQVLGSPFTYDEPSEISPEPVTIGSIFCSDAKGVQARIRANGASEASSTAAQPTQTEVISTLSPPVGTTRTSPSAATARTGNDVESDTTQQTSALATETNNGPSRQSETASTTISPTSASSASVAPKRSSSLPLVATVTATVTTSPSPAVASSAIAAAEFTGGADGTRTRHVWTINKLINVSILAVCYMGWFIF